MNTQAKQTGFEISFTRLDCSIESLQSKNIGRRKPRWQLKLLSMLLNQFRYFAIPKASNKNIENCTFQITNLKL